MHVEAFDKNIPVLVVNDLYTKHELEQMSLEIDSLYEKSLLPTMTGAATTNKLLQKNTKGLFLDEHFNNNRDSSTCLQLNRKVFFKENVNVFKKVLPTFSLISTSNRDTTLISWYDHNTYYKPHVDVSSITALTYFIKDDNFSGGALVFNDFDLKIKPYNGLTVLMVGSLLHSVTQVRNLKDKEIPLRVTMSQFLLHLG